MDSSKKIISMKRSINLLSAISLIVGSIIGSGIFVSPGGVLRYVDAPGTALFIWAFCGIICTIGALCFSELGTMLPTAGGDYAYIHYAFGDLPAFLTLWVNVVVIRPAAQAVVALAFAEYSLAMVFPQADPCSGESMRRIPVILLAVLALSTLTFINCVSVKLAMKVQALFTTAKLMALIGIIIVGLYHITYESFGRLTFVSEKQTIGGFSLALYSGLFAYGGWNYVNFVTEELKDPYRNLPRSIWIALPLVTCIYVLANLAYLTVLTPSEVAQSDAVAVLFGQRVLGSLRYTVPVFVALSTFGSLNGILFTSGRLFLAGARLGHLPPVLAFISIRRRTPIPALLLTCFVSFLMVGFDIVFLINCLSFVLWLSIGLAVLALLWLRKSKPHLPRPIKVHIVLPWLFLVFCIFLVIVPIATEPKSTGLGMLISLSGIPFYLIGVVWKNKPIRLLRFYKFVEIYLQKCLLIVPTEKTEILLMATENSMGD